VVDKAQGETVQQDLRLVAAVGQEVTAALQALEAQEV
jgi:hypothetical protein